MNIQDLKKKGFIKSLQGKDFILYTGLLLLAHERGLVGIETELVHMDWDNNRFVFKAVAIGKDGQRFTGYGDATTRNVGKMILPHASRMAETRAKARALRDFTGLGMTAFEEMIDEGDSLQELKQWANKLGGYDKLVKYCVVNNIKHPIDWDDAWRKKFETSIRNGNINLDEVTE